MKTFAIVILFIIIAIIQHLINWMWRKINIKGTEPDDLTIQIIGGLATAISIYISYKIIILALEWYVKF